MGFYGNNQQNIGFDIIWNNIFYPNSQSTLTKVYPSNSCKNQLLIFKFKTLAENYQKKHYVKVHQNIFNRICVIEQFMKLLDVYS